MRYSVNKDICIRRVLGVLIFSMLIVPVSYMMAKLVIIISFFLILISQRKCHFSNTSILILSLLFSKGVIWLFLGVLNQNNPEKGMQSLVFFHTVAPFLYYIIISFMKTDFDIILLSKTIIFSHLFIVLYNYYSLFSPLLGLPYFEIHQTRTVYVLTDNYSGINSPDLQSLIFTFPFLVTAFVAKFMNRVFVFVLIVLSIPLLVMTGRGMMFLAVLLLPVIPILYSVFMNEKIKRSVVYVYSSFFLLLLMLGFLFYDNVEPYYNAFTKSFDPTNEYVRFKQRESILAAWNESPLIGYGYGKTIYESVERGCSSEFESQYHADLLFTGILGVSIFFFIVVLIFYKLIKYSRRYKNGLYLAYLIGLLLFLIANSTNPFLSTFDRLLPLYLCISIININETKVDRLK